MGQRIREYDWSQTSLGMPHTWPPSLQSTIGIVIHSKFPMFLFWGDELLCFYNDAYRHSLGNDGMHPSALGKTAKEVWPEIWNIIGQQIQQVMTSGEATWHADQLVPIYRNGKLEDVFWTYSYSPVYAAGSKPSGVFVTCMETTDRVTSLLKIEESEEQLRIAIEGAELGTYDFYPQTSKFHWSAKTKELFGLPPDAVVTYDVYLQALHPDDRERSDLAVQTAMQPQNGGMYENEYRTIGVNDGKLRWVRSKGKTTFDTDGKPICFTGIAQDITQQKELMANLQMQSLVLDRMNEGVSISNENGVILFTNPAEDKMFGYEAGELIGKPVTVQNAYAPDENDAIVSGVIAELKEKGYWSGEWHNRKKDGTAFFTHSFITTLNADGNLLFVCVQRDVTQEKDVAEKLAYRKALLEAQNEAIPDAILVVDTKGNILSYNRHFARLWNIPKEIIDRKDDAAALEFAMTQVAEPQGFIDRVNYSYNHPDEAAHEEMIFNDGRIIERWGNAVIGEEGNSYGWIWYFRDITESKAAETALRESESRFRNMADASPVMIWTIDDKGGSSYYNKTFREFLGLKEDDDINNWAPVVHPDDVARCFNTIQSAIAAKQSYTQELRLKRGDETWRWVLAKGSPHMSAAGEFLGFIGSSVDITEMKEAEEKLKEGEEKFRSLANSIPQLSWMANADGGIFWYNDKWYEFTGTTPKQMEGWGWQSVHDPAKLPEVLHHWKNSIESGEPFEMVFPLRGADGMFRQFLTRVLPVLNNEGKICQWFGTNTDITEQINTEEELKKIKDQLELTFQNVPSAIYHFDKAGKIVYLNELGAKQLGYQTADEVLAEQDVYQLRKRLDETFIILDEKGSPLLVDESSAAICFRTGKASEVTAQFIHRETGQAFWLLSKSSPLFNEAGELSIVLTTSTDITPQKTSEQAIRQSEERFRTLAETLPQMIWVRNMNGQIEYGSKNWEDYSGIKDVSEAWMAMTHPDDYEPIMSSWKIAMEEGKPFKYEVRLKNKAGEYRWHSAVGEPVKDAEGNIVKWIGALSDSHDQKTVAEKLEGLVAERTKELQRSNEDLQQFAHVASHDLKEPVRKIRTFGSRLKDEFAADLPEKAKTYLGKMEGAADRIYQMIDGVLLYSSIGETEGQKEQVDLSKVLQSIELDLEVLMQQKGAVIEYNGLPVIEGSSILLYQLFYNLLNNSLKFVKADTAPIINISHEISKGAAFSNADFNADRDYVKISVKDNGIGFEQNFAEMIFQTFSRLNSKDKYEGTGLGLALCKKIAERHGGTITAKGKKGEGASFEVILPVSDKEPAPKSQL